MKRERDVDTGYEGSIAVNMSGIRYIPVTGRDDVVYVIILV